MSPTLREESRKLAGAWMQHEAGWLCDYLVASVEDPRMNLQSMLTRHFLVRELCGEHLGPLMREEYKFSAAMNWLRHMAETRAAPEDYEAVRFALRNGADNAEGIEVPGWLQQIFHSLPLEANACVVPNYVLEFLNASMAPEKQSALERVFNTFGGCWAAALAREPITEKPTVIEPACGSANDYRYLHEYGIARRIDYTGFDLCEKNVTNARALFPQIKFERGNVFEIDRPDKSVRYCIVHDLFEHLSLEGLAVAIQEVCRVTRDGMCVGFFQMDEVPEHVARPVDEYHWNLLSMRRMKEALAAAGFSAQVIHIGTFLKQTTGADRTYNPDAYTFALHAAP